jgi:hypothetical protein
LEDECETCDNDSSNDCIQDSCGVWGGDNSPNTGICDCFAVPNGEGVLDDCLVCDGDGQSCKGCNRPEACNYDPNVTVYILWSCHYDYDCNGECGGTALTDECGDCVEGETGLEACTQDCSDTWGGTAFIDDCGLCVGGDSGLEENYLMDGCGVCGGDGTSCGFTANITLTNSFNPISNADVFIKYD